MTLESSRATAFQDRNSLDAELQAGLDPDVTGSERGRAMLDVLAEFLVSRDPATADHARRVQRLAVEVAHHLCPRDAFLISTVHAAAPLHDIGKLGIPDRILHKPGPLSSDEYELVKRHPAMGADMLASVESGRPLAPILRHHHENWDGTGYPDGLCGDAIPLGARILAVVDCYDALTSKRPYRQPLSHADAMAQILVRRSTMYDPAILDAFAAVVQRLRASDAVLTRDFVAAYPSRVRRARLT